MRAAASYPGNGGQRQLTMSGAHIITIPLGAFIIISHLAIVDAALRQQLMVLISAYFCGMAAIFLARLPLTRVSVLLGTVLVICALVFLHNRANPPLSEYADTKRLYFYFIFLTCYAAIPITIAAFDSKMEQVPKVLMFVTFLFSILAFTATTGNNLRRSGIDLNPLLHAKLLFFPALYLLAQKRNALKRPLLLGLSVFGLLACFQTGSRGPLVVLLLLFMFDRLLTLEFARAFKAVLSLAALAFLLIFLIGQLPEHLADRYTVESLFTQGEEGDRLFLFAFAFDLIQQYPAGIGMGNMSGFYWINAPHNLFIEAVLDLGFIFALPYTALLAYTAWHAAWFMKSSDVTKRFIGAWYLFFFMNSMMGGEMSFPSLPFYIPMGLIILATRSRWRPQTAKFRQGRVRT
ncbi:MAG: O-antigen ligase family protein [Pseudomonadota bacterium]